MLDEIFQWVTEDPSRNRKDRSFPTRKEQSRFLRFNFSANFSSPILLIFLR